MIVQFTAEAESDLEQIGLYIARDNPSRAASYLRDLRRRCMSLAKMPRRFPVTMHLDGLEIRRRVHGNHVIFYSIQAGRVVIFHVLHGAMDHELLHGKS